MRTSPTYSSLDELDRLSYMSRGRLLKLTGPLFPSLEPREAAHVLMLVALHMPKRLRLRTLHLAVNLFETGCWSSGILDAAHIGDPVARSLATGLTTSVLQRGDHRSPLACGAIH